jgi:mannobiose 2-epimerase
LELIQLQKEFETELADNILDFWINKVYDPERRTFFGKVSNLNKPFPEEPHSAVLLTRVLWTFSAAYHSFSKEEEYKKLADEAYRILMENFWDNNNGGIFWCVSPDGSPADTKKQFYAQAFFIYALSEYYRAFKNETAKQLAVSMFMLLEKYGGDPQFGGYVEAKTAEWKELQDQRLSSKDMNTRKSMNTHLHVLEAYTNLYHIWKDDTLKQKLENLLGIFTNKIINRKTGHFQLFFDEDWSFRGEIDSYGHDIEGSWLLTEAAGVLGNKTLISELELISIQMAETTIKEGLGENGGLFYEKENGILKPEFHWWPQAEAVIGFFNAWQISGGKKYFELVLKNWNFIQKYIIDHKNGDWFWGISKSYDLLSDEKVNAWKAPYHNGRMCMEMIRRLKNSSK